MRKVFFLLFLFAFQHLSAQLPGTEGTAIFGDEINKVILNQKNKKSELIFHIYFSQENGKKARWKEKITYKFINDSVLQQSLSGSKEKDLGVIRNGCILEYDMKLNKIASGQDHFGQVVKQFSSPHYRTDTVINKDPNKPLRFVIEGSVDTFRITKMYYLENGNWELKTEEQFHRTKSVDGKSAVDSTIFSDLKSKEKIKIYIVSKRTYLFDDEGRLNKVEVFNFGSEKIWINKNTLMINYKEK